MEDDIVNRVKKGEKEEIIAEADGSDYVRCCRFEQGFAYAEDSPSRFEDHNGGHFEVTIFTTKRFEGKVKITIESLE